MNWWGIQPPGNSNPGGEGDGCEMGRAAPPNGEWI